MKKRRERIFWFHRELRVFVGEGKKKKKKPLALGIVLREEKEYHDKPGERLTRGKMEDERL